MIEIKGFDKLIKDIKAIGVEGEKRIAETTEGNAREIEATAKQIAPYDFGALRQNIKALEQDKLNWAVYANAFGNAPYSAYQEFGTGGLVEVPDELKDIAIKFKGKGIKKIDMRPQPFLYPAWKGAIPQYIKDLESDLIELTKNK